MDAIIVANKARLSELYSGFVPLVEAILLDLKQYNPRIVCAYRSPEEQLRAYRSGHSKLKFGLHNVTGKNGKKESLAVDIIPLVDGYSAPTSFWLKLASSALVHNCESGVLWTGTNILVKHRILQAIKARDFTGYKGKLGWDCSHVQWSGGLTIKQIQKGIRPDD